MTERERVRRRFPRQARLRRQADFDRVHRENCHAADSVLVVRSTVNRLSLTRLGVSVSRQVGSAVERNRWKRLTREAFRLLRADLPPGLDLVVRPRRGAQPDLESIRRSLRRLVARLAARMEPA